MKSNGNRVNGRTVLTITGALIAYLIGAGFASGNEILQVFGSWGRKSVWAILGSVLVLTVGSIGIYVIGAEQKFKGSKEGYCYFGGERFGRLVQIFTGVCLMLNFFTMFAGAGSLMNQHLGIPHWVGALSIGIVSVLALLKGKKTLQEILGYAGIIVLVYMIFFGVLTLLNPSSGSEQAMGATQAVAEGKILQINLFALPPFSWIPGLKEQNNAFLTGALYGAEALFISFPFQIMLAQRCKNRKEAACSAVVANLSFMLCICVVMVILLFNFDCMINPITGKMNLFPTLAAIKKIMPSAAWSYAILCFIGIFTTISGYLSAIVEMVFRQKDQSKKCIAFEVCLTVMGILLGGVLPFSTLINVMLPIRGCVGIVLVVLVLLTLYKRYRCTVHVRVNRSTD